MKKNTFGEFINCKVSHNDEVITFDTKEQAREYISSIIMQCFINSFDTNEYGQTIFRDDVRDVAEVFMSMDLQDHYRQYIASGRIITFKDELDVICDALSDYLMGEARYELEDITEGLQEITEYGCNMLCVGEENFIGEMEYYETYREVGDYGKV